MKTYHYKDLTQKQIELLCKRDFFISKEIQTRVKNIGKKIKEFGDLALKDITKEIDGVDIENFKVESKKIKQASVTSKLENAINVAKENIWKFHFSQQREFKQKIETTQGIYCWQEFRPIQKVGLYIPGGTAPLFSTVLMLVIPALIAGCEKIVICTPPNKKGEIHPEILYTANLLGIEEIYALGGAQAIFALAFGTKSIPKVLKIFGPGNAYVTAAKMQISSFLSIDIPAGPSEVLVIADDTSQHKFLAADLLAQAEHGPDSQIVLISTHLENITKTIKEIYIQLERLPRKEIAKKSLEQGFALLVPNLETAIEFSNLYAPEHLILSFDRFNDYLPKIKNTGSVFCGKYTTESLGDYASGPNHTLPTNGFAKSCSGISVADFGKTISFQHSTKEGFNNLAEIVEIMAESEQLYAHKNAVSIRKKN